MAMRERIRLFEEDSRVLEAIASRYQENSKEYRALYHAGVALWYVLTEGQERFEGYLERMEAGLTPQQRAHLVRMGIDPDSDPDDDT